MVGADRGFSADTGRGPTFKFNARSMYDTIATSSAMSSAAIHHQLGKIPSGFQKDMLRAARRAPTAGQAGKTARGAAPERDSLLGWPAVRQAMIWRCFLKSAPEDDTFSWELQKDLKRTRLLAPTPAGQRRRGQTRCATTCAQEHKRTRPGA